MANIDELTQRLSKDKFKGMNIEWHNGVPTELPIIEDSNENIYYLKEDNIIVKKKESNIYSCYDCDLNMLTKRNHGPELSFQPYCMKCEKDLVIEPKPEENYLSKLKNIFKK